jgi:MFS family permease
MSFLLLLHQLAFVVISPSLWFYLNHLDKVEYYGFIWASFFLGQTIFSCFWYFNKTVYKTNFIISSFLGIISGFIYCYPSLISILISRFLQGCASSSAILSLLQVCNGRNKSKNLTHLFFWQYVGYLIGPIIGWMLSYLPTTLIFWPGYCGLAISFTYIVFLIYVLIKYKEKEEIREGLLEIQILSKWHSNIRLLIFNMVNFLSFFLLSIYDCLITPITLYIYHYDFYIQTLCWIIVGCLILFSFVLLIIMIGKVSDLVLYQSFLTLQFIGVILLLPMNLNIFFVALALVSFSLSGCTSLNLSLYSRELKTSEEFFLFLFYIVGALGRASGSLFFQFLYQDLYQIFITLSILSFISLLLFSLSNILYFTCK